MNVKIFLSTYLLLEILFMNNSFAIESGKNIKAIQNAIEALSSTRSFAYYDLHLSENEKNAVTTLKINKTDSYNNYAHLNTLEFEVREFIKALSKADQTNAKELSQLIVRLVNEIVQASGQETAWVAVRAFTPTSEYDMPR